MSQTTDLNLPDGVLQRYQRRYSDPVPSTPHTNTIIDTPHRPQRFSLTTFDDLKDISSCSVRNRVNKILKCTGFTQCNQSKNSQMRRYSAYVDPKLENNLCNNNNGRRSSFAEKIGNMKEENKGKKRSSWHISRKKSLTSYWNEKDLADYQSHLVDSKPSPYQVCDDQYWISRRSKCVDQSDAGMKIPKSNFKLRDNGLIASELVSSYGVHIQGMSRSVSLNSTHSQTKADDDMEIRPPSAISCSNNNYYYNKNCTLRKGPVSSSSINKMTLLNEQRGVTPSKSPWKQNIDNRFKYSFYNPPTKDTTLSFPPRQTCSIKEQDAKPRKTSDVTFEIIGNPNLHGRPMYSGRIKLCSFRSFSFSE